MIEITVFVKSESGQFVVIDNDNNLKVNISREVIMQQNNIQNATLDDAKSFYIDNLDIALKNKSDVPNVDGYFESSILSTDF